ncbi:CaiB/BaiF CoA transferase family protein [Yinghuangia seranimata]|uniref:CaiB/BaiF CoA transferase family protein n=1 Tax=Yinghuangia seranimata TaxID=408067 RepID=UPI00248C3EFD|nr:CoA transferase [Yinghuangia seranimata]MDI2132434.1 CoA transferase [Yinghuangia seranimata]
MTTDPHTAERRRDPPLSGVRVLDAATLFAGPMAATILGDYGADVVKIEHPKRGDPVRDHGPSRSGVGLWWTMLGRNKHTIGLALNTEEGADVMRRLAADADVLIENFRPGTLERWGLDPAELLERNPRLVVARVTGFGQFGPYARRPGFGTLAESMSGFAAMTGEPDGPPTLPPFGLADGIAALTTAQAVMTALYERDARSGRGQIVDLAIIEPILSVLGPQPIVYDQLGTVQRRTGNRSVNNAPRNTYRCRDGKWVAVSTSAQSIAERVMHLVGHPEVTREPWFASGVERAAHAHELDGYVAAWIAERDLADVVAAFEAAEAAAAPIYDIADVFADPQYQALDTITTVQDPVLGPVRMQNLLYRLSASPGRIAWTGRPRGADTYRVLHDRLGLTDQELDRLAAAGVIAGETA